MECRIVRKKMASVTEAELRGLFRNYQKPTSIQTSLAEMVHIWTPTTAAMDNSVAHIIVNGTSYQNKSREIYMRFYCAHDQVRQNYFHIFWGEDRKKLADYLTKHHPICQHRTMRSRILKPTQKYTENPKYRRTGSGWGCAGTSNLGVTRKLDNTLNRIRNIAPNGTQNQWPYGLSMPT